MSYWSTFKLSLIVCGILLMIAWSAAAKTTYRTLIDNPYRSSGGSCVYDRTGKLVHAPKGAKCEGAPPAAAPDRQSKRLQGDPHAAAGFLKDHQHIAEEIGQLRVAIALENRTEALESVDRILDELVAHLEREEKLCESSGNPRK